LYLWNWYKKGQLIGSWLIKLVLYELRLFQGIFTNHQIKFEQLF
jgi:hypothetical protein